MNDKGLALACRYSYPPNRLHLCGPEKSKELLFYSSSNKFDKGTNEILKDFSTFYPYLELIAGENKYKDPLDLKVVESYWIGNELLLNIKNKSFINHLDEKLKLHKKLNIKSRNSLYNLVTTNSIPHHNFHVMAIWQRTGNNNNLHTIETMDACIINSGVVKEISSTGILVSTRPLTVYKNKIIFGDKINRKILFPSESFIHNKSKLTVGNYISYHWGMLCEKLSIIKLKNLSYYTNLCLEKINNHNHEIQR